MLRITEPIPPIDLGAITTHAPAPQWWLSAYGHQREFGAALLCPVCGTREVAFRQNNGRQDAVIVDRHSGEALLPMDGSQATEERKPNDYRGVLIPLSCSAGHAFVLSVGQHDGEFAEASVMLAEELYAELYPDAKERWE